MSLLAACNALCGDQVRRLAFRRPAMRAHATLLSERLPLGAPAPSDPNAQYRTRCFLEFTVRGVDVDVMAGFVILENGQEHDCALKPEQVAEHILVRGEDIPLQSLEDWRRYYAWMGRTSKVAMIDGKTMR